MFQKNVILAIFLLSSLYCFSQKDTTNVVVKGQKLSSNNIYNPLSPSKAAFYSAVFPGGGQAYNKKYWKVPLAWAAVGIPTYFYLNNNSEYKRYRKAYKLRKTGLVDEFTLEDGTELISLTGLERAQKTLRGNRDLSLLVVIIGYVLQIVEASVNAHLLQFDASDNITVNPTIMSNPIKIEAPSVGFSFKYSF
ncbi:MAG: hypothetical protein HOA34_06765 [Flavobacterium sp.]|nr:hypothetical protein [Flavobacterium sp.]MBT6882095.1 hypothetical protein [Flavobacterium sp.]MBT7424538.1 hypothetical protein [Flavobacterium sp.]